MGQQDIAPLTDEQRVNSGDRVDAWNTYRSNCAHNSINPPDCRYWGVRRTVRHRVTGRKLWVAVTKDKRRSGVWLNIAAWLGKVWELVLGRVGVDHHA